MSFIDSPSFITAIRPAVKAMYRVRGVCRIAEKIHHFYGRHSRLTLPVNDFDGTLTLYCDLHEHISSRIFWQGCHSGDQLRYLDKMMTPSTVFIDIGANQGEFTVFAAKRAAAGAVIAFEPFGANFSRLEKNVAANGFTNVRLVRKGLGERDAVVPMYAPAGEGGDGMMNLGAPTLFPSPSVDSRKEDAEVVTADEALEREERVDIVKIDAEGSELPILRGAARTLERHAPLIILELNEYTCSFGGYHCSDIVEFLRTRKYAVHPITGEGDIGPAVTPDTVDPGHLNYVGVPIPR